MKYLKYILFLLLIVIIAAAIYIAVQPNSYSVTRSKTIQAPASLVYNEVIDFKNWQDWNAWVEEKPEMTLTYPEKTSGIDGSYSWTDDGETGRMKTIAANPNASITQEMQFGEFPKSDVMWEFTPNEDGSTEVKWTISGKDLPFGFKAFAAFSGGMDKQIGPYYERSLELLDRKVVESMKQFNIKVDGITEYGGGFYMYKTTAATGTNISELIGKQYGEIMAYMAKNSIVQTGMPFTIYNEMNPETGNIIMSQAIPVMNKITVENDSEVLCGYIPKTKALKTTLKGNYTYLPDAWEAANKYIAENNLEQSDLDPFEIYANDPGNVPNPSNWVTEIYLPLK
ncbi:GyrI-like domain-containing protein [Olleya sp. YS]|uniref:SRPBCC family protein n=1 Tax=Olleya sp. YS TaxID=3028318 RepID=UPI0024346895|nr:GyrI-like domain-containing protein [Olleya sp. YS]WGD33893.1 SRPBCC family protein [Olleya sp. YS]